MPLSLFVASPFCRICSIAFPIHPGKSSSTPPSSMMTSLTNQIRSRFPTLLWSIFSTAHVYPYIICYFLLFCISCPQLPCKFYAYRTISFLSRISQSMWDRANGNWYSVEGSGFSSLFSARQKGTLAQPRMQNLHLSSPALWWLCTHPGCKHSAALQRISAISFLLIWRNIWITCVCLVSPDK